ncbi:MAG: MFS transporter [Candidatus Shapirobacteria bacterium]|nr:MFS transporter [Candidatus Shapirobacteria bacterium]
MDRNIKLAYILSYIKTSWFFLGVWVFYYLRYTNYAGIGLIETVLIVTTTITEIPTGAIADLLGKKYTLTLSFVFQFLCNLLMALAPNFQMLLFSVFLGAIGGSLYSGTLDALVYDSLKQNKQESRFDKIITNIGSLQLIAIIIAGSLSGLLYSINPSLPFFTLSIFYFIAFLLTFLLQEPKIDTEKFNIKNFIFQTKQGFNQLFQSKNLINQTLLLLSVGGFLVIADEMMDNILVIEFGYKPVEVGLIISFIFLIAVIFSRLTPKINHYFGTNKAIFILGLFTGITFIISPFVGIVAGTISLIFRQSFASTLNNLTSISINQNTDSRYRATTISSFNMIKNFPYVVGAFFLGNLMDLFTARKIAFVLGLLMIILILSQFKRLQSKSVPN